MENVIKARDDNKKQLKLGPAPIASLDDSTFEMDLGSSTSTQNIVREIKHADGTPRNTLRLLTSSKNSALKNDRFDNNDEDDDSSDVLCTTKSTNLIVTTSASGVHLPVTATTVITTPRIDISRASSSSYHEDSRDSSPENVFEQVGTGMLQDSETGIGYREDGALDLRSSTEELYFMERNSSNQEKNSAHQHARRSPVTTKIVEQHVEQNQSTYLNQMQRKDSINSEVIALLSISGRSSRISSVGSQGSTVSRLSAISGISRSPSPHKMLLETSFCGPKTLENSMIDNLDVISNVNISNTICDNGNQRKRSTVMQPSAEILEQVILARENDPTQAIIAEGIEVKLSNSPSFEACNVRTKMTIKKDTKTDTEKKLTKSVLEKNVDKKKGLLTKNVSTQIIGRTPSGVEYIRIKLKPDHLYHDNGLGENEQVTDGNRDNDNISKRIGDTSYITKPVSLSLDNGTPKKNTSNFQQCGQTSMTISQQEYLTPNASPKPARRASNISSIFTGNRSPSPSTVTISRKNSFCSLFKSKDVTKGCSSDDISLGSDTLEIGQHHQHRKKSGSSNTSMILLNESRDPSRSKSRETECGASQIITPTKQKSVLAIFKPKRNSSKSKISSPVKPEQNIANDYVEEKLVGFSSQPSTSSVQTKQRLKYYETPLDGKSIHIPLHSPTEDKRHAQYGNDERPEPVKNDSNSINCESIKTTLKIENSGITWSTTTVTTITATTTRTRISPTTTTTTSTSNAITSHSLATVKNSTMRPTKTRCSNVSEQPNLVESYSKVKTDDAATKPSSSEFDEQFEVESVWSMEVNRNSSMESQETVISASNLEHNVIRGKDLLISPTTSVIMNSTTTNSIPKLTSVSTGKKRILFCTKLGSGSEEQIFETQLSLSKTESLSSQLSDQATTLESPVLISDTRKCCGNNVSVEASDVLSIRQSETQLLDHDDVGNNIKQYNKTNENTFNSTNDDFEKNVKLRNLPPDSKILGKYSSEPILRTTFKIKKSNRHSMYIENMQEIETNRSNKTNQETNMTSLIPNLTAEPDLNTDKPINTLLTDDDVSISDNRTAPIFHIPEPPKNSPSTCSTTSSIQNKVSTISLENETEKIHGTKICDQAENIHTSDSELNSEVDAPVKRLLLSGVNATLEENKSLVTQLGSFEDEMSLPYVATTLPEERTAQVILIPVKERCLMDMKTIPVNRPRSTTPLLNPSSLDEYCQQNSDTLLQQSLPSVKTIRGSKLRISLPRKHYKQCLDDSRDASENSSTNIINYNFIDSNAVGINSGSKENVNNVNIGENPPKPPKGLSNTSKTWYEFAEQGNFNSCSLRDTNEDDTLSTLTPPPLPPRKSPQNQLWINFDNIPEKRKTPKKITTLPSNTATVKIIDKNYDHISFNYVNPEECQCECHHEAPYIDPSNSEIIEKVHSTAEYPPDDAIPLLNERSGIDINSVSDSSEESNVSVELDKKNTVTDNHENDDCTEILLQGSETED